MTARLACEHTSAVVEGVHLIPGFLRAELSAHPIDPIVVEITVVVGNSNHHRAHLHRRAYSEPTRDGQRHLSHLDRILDLQDLLIDHAKATDIPVYDVAQSHDLTQRIVDEVMVRIDSSADASA